MSTFIHLMRGQMSNTVNQLGGKCPYMPFLGRGQMSEGEHVCPPEFKKCTNTISIHAFVLISDNWNGIKENIHSST